MKDKIIIDTSAWIHYFQYPPSVFSEQLKELVFRSEIYVPKIVIAELIQGGHSEKEVSAIQKFLDAFHIIGEKENTWLEAGRLSYTLKKRGKTVNLADCYIATMAKEQNCAILTLDKHFKEIEKESKIKLIPPSV